MRSNSFYNKKSIAVTTGIAILVYGVFTADNYVTLSSSLDLNRSEYLTNYDVGYKKVVALNRDSEIYRKEGDESYRLSDLEYDINSMYLDWSAIEAEREKLRQEEIRIAKLNENNKQQISKLVEVEKSLPLPDIKDNSFKGYMCMHKVTNKTSKQWKFLHSGDFKFNTDDNGIMMYDGYYVVAMGSYYTNYKVGSTFKITLDTGKTINVITGDEKADKDTDINNSYRPKGSGRGEIVEFVIACGEKGKLCNNYKTMTPYNRSLGNLSSLGFQGNVSRIEVIKDTAVKDRLYN